MKKSSCQKALSLFSPVCSFSSIMGHQLWLLNRHRGFLGNWTGLPEAFKSDWHRIFVPSVMKLEFLEALRLAAKDKVLVMICFFMQKKLPQLKHHFQCFSPEHLNYWNHSFFIYILVCGCSLRPDHILINLWQDILYHAVLMFTEGPSVKLTKLLVSCLNAPWKLAMVK